MQATHNQSGTQKMLASFTMITNLDIGNTVAHYDVAEETWGTHSARPGALRKTENSSWDWKQSSRHSLHRSVDSWKAGHSFRFLSIDSLHSLRKQRREQNIPSTQDLSFNLSVSHHSHNCLALGHIHSKTSSDIHSGTDSYPNQVPESRPRFPALILAASSWHPHCHCSVVSNLPITRATGEMELSLHSHDYSEHVMPPMLQSVRALRIVDPARVRQRLRLLACKSKLSEEKCQVV